MSLALRGGPIFPSRIVPRRAGTSCPRHPYECPPGHLGSLGPPGTPGLRGTQGNVGSIGPEGDPGGTGPTGTLSLVTLLVGWSSEDQQYIDTLFCQNIRVFGTRAVLRFLFCGVFTCLLTYFLIYSLPYSIARFVPFLKLRFKTKWTRTHSSCDSPKEDRMINSLTDSRPCSF